MPHVVIKLVQGKTEDQKNRLMEHGLQKTGIQPVREVRNL